MRFAPLCALLVFLACTETTEPPIEPDCLPSRVDWDERVEALVMANCGQCHGSTPDFGAPFTLLDYDAITAGDEGSRIVDRMHVELAAFSMPPVGATPPTLEDRDAIAGWASCGEVTIDIPVGATRPPFVAPADPPEGLETIDLLADNVAVGPFVLDRYNDFDFTNIKNEEVFIRRFDAVIDESRVIHHLTLRRGDPAEGELNMKYLYAWAPGTGAIEFPDGGVRLLPGDNLRLQIHYNNGAGIEGIEDNSGVRLWVGPPEGDEYYMIDPGPGATGFRVPARSSETVENTCEFSQGARAIASMPHMHEIGQAFDLLLQRGDGEPESILALSSWSFESQIFYQLPIDFNAGDRLTVRCDFDNPGSSDVSAGARTQDEMCFAFTYVTPPPTEGRLCRLAGSGGTTEIDYVPGVCIDAPLEAPVQRGEIIDQIDAPTLDIDGTMPDGRFTVSRFVVSTPQVGIVSIATFNAAGQFDKQGMAAVVDAAIHVIAPIDEARDGVQTDFSFGGTLNAASGPSTMTPDCPASGFEVPLTFGTVGGQPVIHVIPEGFPVELEMWLYLEEG